MGKRVYPNRWFWITLIIPVILLLSLIVRPSMVVFFGKTIALQTVPYDPTDVFYGDYAILKFEIEDVKGSLVDADLLGQLTNGQDGVPVYVSLKQNGNVYVVQQISEKRPNTELYLKGNLETKYYNPTADGEKIYHVDYGLDRYYVEEGTGKELERKSQQGKLIAQLKVKNGYAVITSVK
jgi:uncharacterized membrane-anchored protein